MDGRTDGRGGMSDGSPMVNSKMTSYYSTLPARIPARKDIRRNPRSDTINARNNRSIQDRPRPTDRARAGVQIGQLHPNRIASHRRYPDHITVSPIDHRSTMVQRGVRRGRKEGREEGGLRFFGIIISRCLSGPRSAGSESVNGCRFEQVVPPPLPLPLSGRERGEETLMN